MHHWSLHPYHLLKYSVNVPIIEYFQISTLEAFVLPTQITTLYFRNLIFKLRLAPPTTDQNVPEGHGTSIQISCTHIRQLEPAQGQILPSSSALKGNIGAKL